MEDQSPAFDDVYDYFRDVVEAVVAAHAVGIVHRDIKPDNVVIDSSSPKRRAFLIDFGICQFEEGEGFRTTVDEPLGNRSFAAPELELGSGLEPGQKSDVYSLGKLLYWCVTGGRFFPREALSENHLGRIPQPREVERSFIERLIQRTVKPVQTERVNAAELLGLTESYGSLMKQGVSAVGSKDPICPVCRLGRLKRRNNFRGTGISQPGDLPGSAKLLHFEYCGYLQIHDIRGTASERERVWD